MPTATDRLKLLDEWLRKEAIKLNQRRLQAGLNPGNPDLQRQLQGNLAREIALMDVMEQLKEPDLPDPDDWADKFKNPEEDGSLFDDSRS